MAYTSAYAVVVGAATKKTDIDGISTNTDYLQTLANVEHDFHVSTGTGKHKAIDALDTSVAGATVRDMVVAEQDPASGTPIAGQGVAFVGKMSDSAGNQDAFGRVKVVTKVVTSGSEHGRLDFEILKAGAAFTLRKVSDRWGMSGWDGVVEGTDGDFTTLQAADDELDDNAPYSMFVKNGTYAAGLTISTNGAYVYAEPGTVIQGAIVLSGNNITLRLGAGCDIQNTITLSGTGCTLVCENGCDIDGIVVSGADCRVDGGGFETIVAVASGNGIYVTGARAIVERITANVTGGTTRGINVDTGADNSIVRDCRGISASSTGIQVATAAEVLVAGCYAEGSNGPYQIEANRCRFIGNHGLNTAGSGSGLYWSGDNGSIIANHIEGSGGTGITLPAGADNNIVDGNITDYGISDSGTGNTIGDNEQY